jgi:hypothetical protein
MCLQEIKSQDGQLIAVLVRASFRKNGVNFISEDDFPLQLGISGYKKGATIQPHFHVRRRTVIDQIQEVVYIEKGRATVNLCGSNGESLAPIEMRSGDTILLVDGGHGFEISEDTTIIEVKQGPYLGKDIDKTILDSSGRPIKLPKHTASGRSTS